MTGGKRKLLVDASAFITLAEIGNTGLISHQEGYIEMPVVVEDEITDDPASTIMEANEPPFINTQDVRKLSENESFDVDIQRAASHLGVENPAENWHGDVALLAYALALRDHGEEVVIISDDRPLRKTCKALSVPVSGSIGVLIRAVECGDISPVEAKENLYAMDEVGARLSASLVRRAETMIDEAAENET